MNKKQMKQLSTLIGEVKNSRDTLLKSHGELTGFFNEFYRLAWDDDKDDFPNIGKMADAEDLEEMAGTLEEAIDGVDKWVQAALGFVPA